VHTMKGRGGVQPLILKLGIYQGVVTPYFPFALHRARSRGCPKNRGGYPGPKVGLDVLVKPGPSCPCGESNHDPSVVQALA